MFTAMETLDELSSSKQTILMRLYYFMERAEIRLRLVPSQNFLVLKLAKI